jgi:hypothetical protein
LVPVFGKHHASRSEPERDDVSTKVITLWSNAIQLAQKWRPRMNRAFVITAVLLLSPFPAFSQTGGGEGRDSSYSRKDRDLEDILRGMGDHGREGPRRGGAAFFLRSGDGTVAVRCDPQDSMKSCVEATLTLMDRARSMQPSGGSPGGQPPSR